MADAGIGHWANWMKYNVCTIYILKLYSQKQGFRGGKWKLVGDVTKYGHRLCRVLYTGKHADYIATDIETVIIFYCADWYIGDQISLNAGFPTRRIRYRDTLLLLL
jgi:hypothetical protein